MTSSYNRARPWKAVLIGWAAMSTLSFTAVPTQTVNSTDPAAVSVAGHGLTVQLDITRRVTIDLAADTVVDLTSVGTGDETDPLSVVAHGAETAGFAIISEDTTRIVAAVTSLTHEGEPLGGPLLYGREPTDGDAAPEDGDGHCTSCVLPAGRYTFIGIAVGGSADVTWNVGTGEGHAVIEAAQAQKLEQWRFDASSRELPYHDANLGWSVGLMQQGLICSGCEPGEGILFHQARVSVTARDLPVTVAELTTCQGIAPTVDDPGCQRSRDVVVGTAILSGSNVVEIAHDSAQGAHPRGLAQIDLYGEATYTLWGAIAYLPLPEPVLV